MNTKEIQDKLNSLRPGETIKILGYENSKGEHEDLHLRKLGPEGYKALVRQSKELVDRNDIQPGTFDGDPTGEVWDAALKEVSHALSKSLSSTADRPKSVQDPKYVYAYGWEKVDPVVQEPVGKALKTKMKNFIKAQLPHGNYVHCVKLQPGKFKDLQ